MGCKSMTQESAVPSPTVFTIVLAIVRMKNFTVNIYRNHENNISKKYKEERFAFVVENLRTAVAADG